MSKPEKKVTIKTPPPAEKEEKEEKEVSPKKEEEGVFFNIPVHIIPPGAKFRGPGHKTKTKLKRKSGSPEKPKEATSVQPSTWPHQHKQIGSVADDPSTSAHDEKEIFPGSNGFTFGSCPCCKDRNQENLKQMDKRGYRFPVFRRHSNPVGYFLPNLPPSRPTEIHLLLEIKRAPLQNGEDLDEKSAAVLKSVTKADARYEDAMKKLATSVEKFSLSEKDNDTGESAKSEKSNKASGTETLAQAEKTTESR